MSPFFKLVLQGENVLEFKVNPGSVSKSPQYTIGKNKLHNNNIKINNFLYTNK
jgi:hypothetical protein